MALFNAKRMTAVAMSAALMFRGVIAQDISSAIEQDTVYLHEGK